LRGAGRIAIRAARAGPASRETGIGE